MNMDRPTTRLPDEILSKIRHKLVVKQPNIANNASKLFRTTDL